jgi:hypothetical protein
MFGFLTFDDFCYKLRDEPYMAKSLPINFKKARLAITPENGFK